MKPPFVPVLKVAQGLFAILSLLVFSGCVTAKMPAAPDAARLRTYPDKTKIAVAVFKDTRNSEKAGMIGLATISVKKADLEKAVTGYALDCLNQQLDVNVEQVRAGTPEDVRKLAATLGVKGLLLGKITKLEVSAVDAAMSSTKSVIEGEVTIYDEGGQTLFSTPLKANYSEYLGFKEVQRATGKLVDATARAFAHEMGSKLHEQGVLKKLQ